MLASLLTPVIELALFYCSSVLYSIIVMTDISNMTGQELKNELDKLRFQIKDMKQQINDSSDDTETDSLNEQLTRLQTRKNELREAFNSRYTEEASNQ